MATRREQILQALKARLGALSGLGITGVHRSRADPFQPDEAPALNLVPDLDEPAENTIGMIDSTLSVEVHVFHRGQEPDALADPIVQAVHAALMTEPTLGGLAIDIAEGSTGWEFDSSDRTSLLVRLKFTVMYRHPRSSLQ